MRWRPLLVLLLIVAACSDAAEETTTSSTTVPATTTSSIADRVAPGRLAVVDDDGNVVVMTADGAERTELTDDGGVDAIYSQPTWSPSGTELAWGQATETGFALGLKVVDGSATELIPMSNLPFYMFWSPDGSHIGALHNGSDGLDFEVVDVSASESSVLGKGAPFYFSWSPLGGRVVVHVGEQRFAYLDLNGDATELDPTAGTYLAPQWTERGIVHVSDGSLVVESEDGERSPVAPVEGLVTFFVASQDGSLIAAQSLADGGGISVGLAQTEPIAPNAVWVVDVDSGSLERVSNRPALAFFWNSDGDSLLMLVASSTGDSLVPVVWSKAGGTMEYAEFSPSPNLTSELLPFFPQYAQSMTLWSPDSTAFAYPGEVGGERGIWVQQVDGGDPKLVSDGAWVSWSP